MHKSTNEFYDFILDSLTQGFAIQDVHGKMIRYNRAAFDILGFSEEEFMSDTIEREGGWCFNEDGTECGPENLPSMKVLRTGHPQKNVVLGIRQKNKKLRWIQVNSIPFDNQIPESPIAVLTTYTDVTAQINERNSLSKRETQLLETQAVARIGCWHVDLKTGVTTWTSEMFKLFDVRDGIVPPADVISGKMHPEDRQQWADELDRSLLEKRTHHAKFRIIHRDRIIWAECHGRYIFSAEGLPVEMNGTCQDITETTQLEMRNSFIISSLKIGIWKWDIGKNRLDWDDRLIEIFDVKSKVLTHGLSDWENALHPDDIQKSVDDLEKALTGEKNFETTFRIIDSKGQIRHIGGKGTVFRDEKGDPQFMYGINWDRTHEVLLEQEIEAERLKSVQVSKLSSLGEMAGGVAHEINNPLTIINSSVIHIKRQLSKKTLTDEKLLDSLQDIDVTVKRISQIVMGLRNLSRDSSSEKVTTFRLRDVFTDVLSICNEKFKMNDVQFEVLDPEALFDESIDCRQIQLSQVILNLFTNAYDAIYSMKEKWVHLKLRKQDSRILIQIEDAGLGIPESLEQKIFNPFFTTKEVGKGTGLGLSLSKTLVENNGGKLYLNKETPHTCFVIDLPLSKKAA